MTTKRCERCWKETSLDSVHTCTPKEIERIKWEIEEEKQKQSKLYEEAKSKSKQIKEIHTEFFNHHKPFETMTEPEANKEQD